METSINMKTEENTIRIYRLSHDHDEDGMESRKFDTMEEVHKHIREKILRFVKGFIISEDPREYVVTFEDIDDIRTCEVVKHG